MDHDDADAPVYYAPDESPMVTQMKAHAEEDQRNFDDLQSRNLMDAVTASEKMAEGGVPSEKRPV